jgi:hypothetical protein
LKASHSSKRASGTAKVAKSVPSKASDEARTSKKDLILELAHSMERPHFSAPEVEQIRRQLIVRLGESGKTGPDYILTVLAEAGLRVVLSTRSDTGERYEEEFAGLLHFSTLEDAEMCLVRLDELLQKFIAEGEKAAAERVREVGRMGRRRAQMIARNHKVDERKRREKEEIAQWFALWLETPRAFFDWLEVRKQAPAYLEKFPQHNDQ